MFQSKFPFKDNKVLSYVWELLLHQLILGGMHRTSDSKISVLTEIHKCYQNTHTHTHTHTHNSRKHSNDTVLCISPFSRTIPATPQLTEFHLLMEKSDGWHTPTMQFTGQQFHCRRMHVTSTWTRVHNTKRNETWSDAAGTITQTSDHLTITTYTDVCIYSTCTFWVFWVCLLIVKRILMLIMYSAASL